MESIHNLVASIQLRQSDNRSCPAILQNRKFQRRHLFLSELCSSRSNGNWNVTGGTGAAVDDYALALAGAVLVVQE